MIDQGKYESPSLEVLGTLYDLTQNGSVALAVDAKGKAPGNLNEISPP